jgi:hypothetical protein
MAVTSCHYTPLISPAPPAGVDKHTAISSKFRGKICITNSLYWVFVTFPEAKGRLSHDVG